MMKSLFSEWQTTGSCTITTGTEGFVTQTLSFEDPETKGTWREEKNITCYKNQTHGTNMSFRNTFRNIIFIS